MSHDIRTPLTGIIGLSGILEDELIDEEQKESAHMLNMSGEQLLSLLNSILDIVSSGSVQETKLNLSSFNLEEMLQNIFELQLPALQLKSICLNLKMENAIPKMIESDKGKIYRILLNLLSNAIKFTTEGQITISVKLKEQHETSSLLEFKIEDSGIGIDEKDQEKIFEEFFRATPSYQGTYDGYGVGLAIVKQYLQCLEGDIEVQSCLNQGTTVTVCIPVKTLNTETIAASHIQQEATVLSSKALSAATSTESDSNLCDKRPFVLLVEDNPMAMRVASMMLNKGHCHYLQAATGEEALTLVKNNRFHWIISDIGLPDFSGFVLAKKIADFELQQGLSPTPIVGLTAHAKEEAQSHAEQSGMKAVFEKPLKLEQLQSLIEQYYPAHNPTASAINKPITPSAERPALFDFEKALSQLGNKETVVELIDYMLANELTHSVAEINNCYQQQNWEAFKSLVHKFKSSCLYCATTRLLDITQMLEKEALNPDAALKAQLYQDFKSICADTKEHLKDWLARQ